MQDPRGISSLNLLEQALADGDSHAFTYFAFDLCYLDGFDLSAAKLIDRRAALEGLIEPLIDARSPVQFSEHVEGDMATLSFAYRRAAWALRHRLQAGGQQALCPDARSTSWVKVKRVQVGAFVIIGFISNMPLSASSLLLAEERAGELVYACRVGSGIGDAKARALYAVLSKQERASPPVAAPRTAGAHWIEPEWGAEIGFRERSTQGAPRAPVLLGYAPRPRERASTVRKPKLVGDRELAAVQLTNPEREMFAGSGVTKLDLALYYARVGDWLLPELLRRPVTVLRCPTGALKDCFYQRHAFAGLPDGVETVDLADEQERAAFITVTEPCC